MRCVHQPDFIKNLIALLARKLMDETECDWDMPTWRLWLLAIFEPRKFGRECGRHFALTSALATIRAGQHRETTKEEGK